MWNYTKYINVFLNRILTYSITSNEPITWIPFLKFTCTTNNHFVNVFYIFEIPRTKIFSEFRSTKKHTTHGRDFFRIPVNDFSIEAFSVIKHKIHAHDSLRVPSGDIRIETFSTIKHTFHCRDFARIPIDNIVKASSATKH